MSRTIHKLKARRLETLSTPGWHGDGGGLWLRIKPSGSKSWKFIWIRDKVRREMGLGSYDAYTLDDAREMAAAARNLLKEGYDPIEMRQTEQEEERAERKKEEQEARPATGSPTFLAYAKKYIAAHEGGWSNAKHIWQWTNSLEKHAKGILNIPVDKITPQDVAEALKTSWTKFAETAGRVRGRIENVLDAAKAEGHIQSPWENPAKWKGNLQFLLPKRKRLVTGHHAAIPYEDMPEFFEALQKREAPTARALELTVLCATRTSETLLARWSEVDLDRSIWTIPAERMKMRIEHRIPLSYAAVAVLRAVAEGKPCKPGDYIFPGQKPDSPLSQMAMPLLMRRMNLGQFTVHGMRSSFRDYMGDETDHAETVIEHALAHQVGSSVTRAYRRKDAFEKRKSVMADWADYLQGRSPNLETAGQQARAQILEEVA
nr:integrase arm-type DNA-binding domain-containing protein [Sphingomonas sp. CDS-1]